MKKLLLIISCLILNLNIFAAVSEQNLSAQEKEIFNAMQTEMKRNLKELKMDKFARPYFITYKIIPYTKYVFGANQGVLTRINKTSYPYYEVQMRVGTPKEDNSFFLPGVSLPQMTNSSFALNNEGVSKFLWQITDNVYKNAIAELNEKQAYKKNKHLVQEYADFSFYPAQEYFDTLTEPVIDSKYWQKVVKQTSAKGTNPKLEEFKTLINIKFIPSYFISSRGSKYLQDKYFIEIVFTAKGRLEDGFEFNLSKAAVYADFKDVPSLEKLEKTAEDFSKEVVSLQKAKKMGAYIGPVLLEGAQAAGLLDLLQNEISFTKKVNSTDDSYSFMGDFADKLGLKVFSSGFDVVDDPLRKTFDNKKLAGYYEIDEEGVKAEKIQIIENGILKDLPFTASLTKNNSKSNGHGRYYYTSSGVVAVPSNLILFAHNTIAEEDFLKTFQDFCAQQGLKSCPIIKARDERNFFGYMLDSKTGEKTPVYGEFPYFSTRNLRDIKYASDKMQVYNQVSRGGLGFSIITPDLILDNGEINQTKKEPARKPLVERP
jgi:hypothetical protein